MALFNLVLLLSYFALFFCLLSVYLVLLACDIVYLIFFITFYYTRWHLLLASLLFFVLSCMSYMHQFFFKEKICTILGITGLSSTVKLGWCFSTM